MRDTSPCGKRSGEVMEPLGGRRTILGGIGLNQHVRGDVQRLGQFADHRQAQRALTSQHLRDTSTPAQQRFQILPGQAQRFHAMHNGGNRVWSAIG